MNPAQAIGWTGARACDASAGLRSVATGLAAQRQGVSADDEAGVARVAAALNLRFDGEQVLLDGVDVAAELRQEQAGSMASRISAHPAVRGALHALQLGFQRLPGLVCDGRDMGTVIFPAAPLKVFLTASPAMRAERRCLQLMSKGIPATLADLRADLEARDARDKNRAVAPLKPAEDALLLDNSGQTIAQSVDQVLAWWAQRQPFQATSNPGD